MSNNSARHRTADLAPDAPLTDLEAISTVQLFQSVPAFIPEPIASVARRTLAAAPGMKQIAKIYLAVWPDGTCALLAHNPDWNAPRVEQTVRAYRIARRQRFPELIVECSS